MSAPFSITITDHAIWRVAERFGCFGMDWMEDEILAAFREKRVSPDTPPRSQERLRARKPVRLDSRRRSRLRAALLR